MKKKFITVSIFLLLCTTLCSILASAATLHGTIYDQNQNAVNKVTVLINSTPQQRHISKYGGYFFNLEKGTYTINVTLTSLNKTLLIAQDSIKITGNGDYIVDLVTFPHIDLKEEFNITNEPEEVGESKISVKTLKIIGITLVIILAISGIILFVIQIMKKKKKKSKPDSNIEYNIEYHEDEAIHNTTIQETVNDETIKQINLDSPDDAIKKKIISLISNNDDQITQKEIRKKINLSEAKISQIISDLEKDKKIKKIKKGRINILIINK